MVESKAVKNVVIFNDEVIVDINISNPTLQARKRTEVNIMKAIHDLVYAKAKIKINVKVDVPAQPKMKSRVNPFLVFKILLQLLREKVA